MCGGAGVTGGRLGETGAMTGGASASSVGGGAAPNRPVAGGAGGTVGTAPIRSVWPPSRGAAGAYPRDVVPVPARNSCSVSGGGELTGHAAAAPKAPSRSPWSPRPPGSLDGCGPGGTPYPCLLIGPAGLTGLVPRAGASSLTGGAAGSTARGPLAGRSSGGLTVAVPSMVVGRRAAWSAARLIRPRRSARDDGEPGLGWTICPGTTAVARARATDSARSSRARAPIVRPGSRTSPRESWETNQAGR